MEGRAKHLQHPTPRDGSNLGIKTVWKTAVDGKEDLRPLTTQRRTRGRRERTLRRESKSKEKKKSSDFIKSAKVKSLPHRPNDPGQSGSALSFQKGED
jgi:hypothetical protein